VENDGMNKQTSIGDRIKAHRKARGLTLVQLEEITGIDNGNLSRIEREHQSLTNDTMKLISKALGISLSELFADSPEEADTIAGRKAGRGQGSIPPQPVSSYKKLSDIPEGVNVALSAVAVEQQGKGENSRPSWKIDDTQQFIFQAESLRNLESKPSDLASVKIKDDTMQPRLHAGDFVVVDTADTHIPDTGGVYAVIIDGRHISIRRLYTKPGGGLMVSCDNTNYPAINLTADELEYISVIGRVKAMRGNAGF
jgi:phage repressor protein C with HTH and peptisase S24 domain